MRLALFEPEIPQNAGALIRLGACLGVRIDVIEPCGFLLDHARMKRAGMDYLNLASVVRHVSWYALSWYAFARATTGRKILITTKPVKTIPIFNSLRRTFSSSAAKVSGCPSMCIRAAAARLRIPMKEGLRSLNVALTAAMVLGEALRQAKSFP